MFIVTWEYKTDDFWEDSKVIITNDAHELVEFHENAEYLIKELREDPDVVSIKFYKCEELDLPTK